MTLGQWLEKMGKKLPEKKECFCRGLICWCGNSASGIFQEGVVNTHNNLIDEIANIEVGEPLIPLTERVLQDELYHRIKWLLDSESPIGKNNISHASFLSEPLAVAICAKFGTRRPLSVDQLYKIIEKTYMGSPKEIKTIAKAIHDAQEGK